MTQTVWDVRLSRAQDLRGLRGELGLQIGVLDPAAVHLPDALGLFEELDAIERLAAAGKTLIAARVEEANSWKRAGFRSAAEQMAAVAGSSISAAHNQLETSKQVDALPATAAALRSGSLSAPKAQAIASAATVAPEAEAALLAIADAPLGMVRKECLQAKAVDRDAAHKRIRCRRYAREFIDGEGAWNFMARGTADDGARFRFAHEPIVDEMFKAARDGDRTETREALAFDALIELANRATGTTKPSGATESSGKTPPRFMALLRLDITALQRGWVEGDEICELPGLGPIPVWKARELLGDSILKLVITKGVDVANVTHLGRGPTVAQQVALWWRSPECIVEGCTRCRRLENEHRIDWAKTKHTVLHEMEEMCGHDHHLKTDSGWALVAGTGKRPLVPPHDPRHPKYRAPPDQEVDP